MEFLVASIENRFYIKVEDSADDSIWNHLREGNILNEDEYMVLCVRVKRNKNGEIIGMNRAKILGPLRFAETLVIGQSVFNPRVNDYNLEFDVKQNLSKDVNNQFLLP